MLVVSMLLTGAPEYDVQFLEGWRGLALPRRRGVVARHSELAPGEDGVV